MLANILSIFTLATAATAVTGMPHTHSVPLSHTLPIYT